MVDECYFCRFDSKCNIQCKDDGFCSLSRFDLLSQNLIGFCTMNKPVRCDREKNIIFKIYPNLHFRSHSHCVTKTFILSL